VPLRKIARELGVPEEIINRSKRGAVGMSEIEELRELYSKEKIKLFFGENTATLSINGGCLQELFINGQEVFYPESLVEINGQQKKRGGLPILFPWAGALEGFKQHGFARDLSWQDLSNEKKLKGNEALLVLESNPQTQAVFPYQFRNELYFSLFENGIFCQLTVFNQDKKEMPVAFGFHPYFKIPQEKLMVVKTNLKGFDLSNYQLTDTLFFPMKEEIKINIGEKYKIKMEIAGDFLKAPKPQIACWTDDERYFCIEPWSVPLGGFSKDQEKVIIPPGESKKYIMNLSFTS
jgi:galactose mutarotase-like enzyme